MKSLRYIGSLAFVVGLFVSVFAGMPWYVMVADDPWREARQDPSEGDAALEIRDVPTCRSGCDAEVVRSDSRPH